MKRISKVFYLGVGFIAIVLSLLPLFNHAFAHETDNVYNPKVDYVGKKFWNDNSNNYNTRPTDLKVVLYADGTLTDYVPTWSKEDNEWTYTFKDVPIFDINDGHAIKYHAEEENVDGYLNVNTNKIETEYKLSSDVGTITKTRECSSISFTLASSETDLDFIAIQGTKGGNNFLIWTPRKITSSEKQYIKDALKNKGVYNQISSAIIEYSSGFGMQELVSGRTANIIKNSDGSINLVMSNTSVWATWAHGTLKTANYNVGTTEFTNELNKISISGTKIWDDSDNQDGIRPDSITVRLYADGIEVDSKEVTEYDNWSYNFDNLDKYVNGAEINYTISEDQVEGYETELSGYNIINIHKIDKNEKNSSDDSDIISTNKTIEEKEVNEANEVSAPNTGIETSTGIELIISIISFIVLLIYISKRIINS